MSIAVNICYKVAIPITFLTISLCSHNSMKETVTNVCLSQAGMLRFREVKFFAQSHPAISWPKETSNPSLLVPDTRRSQKVGGERVGPATSCAITTLLPSLLRAVPRGAEAHEGRLWLL